MSTKEKEFNEEEFEKDWELMKSITDSGKDSRMEMNEFLEKLKKEKEEEE